MLFRYACFVESVANTLIGTGYRLASKWSQAKGSLKAAARAAGLLSKFKPTDSGSATGLTGEHQVLGWVTGV